MASILFFCFLAVASPSDIYFSHDFHFSKCLIELNPEQNTLQISWHIFLDDLEQALENQGTGKLFLCTAKESEKGETYLFKYLTENLNIKIDNEPFSPQWVGKELSDDLAAVWCYFEIKNIEGINKIEITNTLLTELFDDQKNIVHLLGPKNRNGYFMFDNAKIKEMIVF